MDIIVNWDSSAASAPAGFEAAISYVVSLFDALFTNSETITLAVGFGEVGGIPLPAGDVGSSISSLVLTTGVANFGTVAMSTAEYKAFGGTISVPTDGYVGFNSTGVLGFSNLNTIAPGQYDFVAVAEHEISEVLGRISTIASTGFPSVLDELRYSSPGTLATASSAVAYFSLDGGTTDLGNYNTTLPGDLGDWSPTGTLAIDAFAATGTPGVTEPLSVSDILLMNAIGYTYNQNIEQALLTHNPILGNAVVGSATNFAGLGGADLFVLRAGAQLGFSELVTSGASAATTWFTWQSDGSASPESNALQVTLSSLVTGTGVNALGHGGQDVTVRAGFGTGPIATYEFTSAGAVYAGGNVLFSGSGDVINGVAGATIELTSGAGNNVLISSGIVIIDAAAANTNVIGSNNTISLAGSTYLGLIGGIGNVVTNDVAGSAINLTSGVSATINGSGGYFGICGSGIDVAASGENVATIGGASFNLTGDSNSVHLGANTYLGLIGGAGNVVGNDVAGTTVNLTSNASAAINGSGGYFGICGSGIVVAASGESVATIDGASFNLFGNANSIRLGAGSYLGLIGGTGNVVANDVAGATVNLTSNASATINGSGGYIGICGSNINVTASGENFATVIGASFSLFGGDDVIALGSGSTVNLLGSSGGIAFISGSLDSLSILANAGSQDVAGFNMANGDRIDLSQILAGTSVTLASLGNYVSVSPNGTGTGIAIAGPNGSDMIDLSGVGALSLASLIGNNAFVLPAH